MVLNGVLVFATSEATAIIIDTAFIVATFMVVIVEFALKLNLI